MLRDAILVRVVGVHEGFELNPVIINPFPVNFEGRVFATELFAKLISFIGQWLPNFPSCPIHRARRFPNVVDKRQIILLHH